LLETLNKPKFSSNDIVLELHDRTTSMWFKKQKRRNYQEINFSW